MRLLSIGQALSSEKDRDASEIPSVDKNGVATMPHCGDSTFIRFDREKKILTGGVFDDVGEKINAFLVDIK